MDIRVRDWSTEGHADSASSVGLRRASVRVVGAVAAVWLTLFALSHAFPFVENGAAAVGQLKFAIAAQPSLFEPKSNVRLFTFGNSQFLAGIEPRLLDRDLGDGVETVNLAVPGEERYVNLLETALKAGNVPTTILVQAMPIKSERESWWTTFLDNKRMINILFPFKDYVRDFVLFTFEARGPSGFVRQYRSNAAQLQEVVADRGWYFIKSQSHFPDDSLPDDYALPTDQPGMVAHRELDLRSPEFNRLVALADQYDFQIFVIPNAFREGSFAPPGPTEPDYTTALAAYPRIHVMGPPYLLTPRRSFSDQLHLNPKGAETYTATLAAMLRAPLGLAK